MAGLMVAAAGTATLAVLPTTKAAADPPPITVGLLDPNCPVQLVVNGATICLIYSTTPPPAGSTTPPLPATTTR